MKRTAWPALVAIAMVVSAAAVSPAAAADKAHLQLLAEIRMMQEQQAQLQQLIGGLTDALKSVNTKIDDQSAASRKALADQKLLIDSVAEGVRILREKADDTNVRLSTVTQELDAVRQTIAAMPSPTAPPPSGLDPLTGTPSQTGTPTTAAPPPPSAPGGAAPLAARQMFDNAYSDYTAGQYDIAIIGFNTFISSFPKHEKADDAQLNIGQALYGSGKFREAIEAFQKVITNYPQADSVPVAYYKMGITYDALQQLDLARKSFETVIQK
ncbi:MAG: tetratricopeptide repeat protein, partial [Acidobacteriota bacterium]